MQPFTGNFVLFCLTLIRWFEFQGLYLAIPGLCWGETGILLIRKETRLKLNDLFVVHLFHTLIWTFHSGNYRYGNFWPPAPGAIPYVSSATAELPQFLIYLYRLVAFLLFSKYEKYFWPATESKTNSILYYGFYVNHTKYFYMLMLK